MGPKGNQVIEAYMPSLAKEEGIGSRTLNREENNSQEVVKNKCLVNKNSP